ncbi:MAG: tetratricopeptide repeat protein [Candidatus Poribacteria bacterium]|nr:tetratricopeptide repeat protein [Candidatus Poribacteria bacterium]MDE0505776.1 tetratricopeptide repeat protein [Candidatus Poribacteria bacterium]
MTKTHCRNAPIAPAIILFLALLPTAHSQVFNKSDLLDFADSLFREEDYLNASHEYRRYLFLFPKEENGDFVQFRLAASYQNAGRFTSAIQAYQLLIDTYPTSPLMQRAQSNIAQCQLLDGHKDAAVRSLQRFLAEYPDSDLAPRAHFMIATVQMEEKDWEKASKTWEQIAVKYPNTGFAEASDRLTRMVRSSKLMPKRSPTFSGLLSAVIPGLGQAYSGRFLDGLQSLTVVGTIGAGTAYYINQEQYEVAIPVGLLGLFFYAGNVYGGMRAAKAFNNRQEGTFLDGLRDEIFDSGVFSMSRSRSTDVSLVFLSARF